MLNEGDVLYHPAGIWHSVYCNEDSIAINMSMKAMRLGEFITQAIHGRLFTHLNQRQFLRSDNAEDMNAKLAHGFRQAAKVCESYAKNPQALVPQGLHIPRYIHVDLDKPLQE